MGQKVVATISPRIHGGGFATFAMTLCIGLFTALTGCASVAAHKGIEPTDLSPIQVGATRETVESVLGEPLESERSDELTVATYKYDRGRPPQDFDSSGFVAEILFLPWQPFIWGAVAESREKQKGQLTIKYGPDDTVVEVDPILEQVRQKRREGFIRAACGDATAQYMAGYKYENGVGVARDLVKAYVWYSIAATNGRSGAAWQRDHVAKTMTAEQIAKAEKMVQDWDPGDCSKQSAADR